MISNAIFSFIRVYYIPVGLYSYLWNGRWNLKAVFGRRNGHVPALNVMSADRFVHVPSGKMMICGHLPPFCARCRICLMVLSRELGSSRVTNTGCVYLINAEIVPRSYYTTKKVIISKKTIFFSINESGYFYSIENIWIHIILAKPSSNLSESLSISCFSNRRIMGYFILRITCDYGEDTRDYHSWSVRV